MRDQRELFRTRMVLTRQKTRLKNQIQATLAKCGLEVEGVSDVFGKKGRAILESYLEKLPQHTRFGVKRVLDHDVPATIAGVPSRAGHEVILLRQILPVSTSDAEVLEAARHHEHF